MIAIVLLYFLSAINLMLRKMVILHAQPIFFQGVRLVTAGFILLISFYARRPNLFYVKKKDIGLFVQAALFFAYLSYVMSIVSLDDLSSARVSFLFNLMPFITALIMYWFFSESLSRKKIIGLCLGLTGFLPLLLVGQTPFATSASFLSIPGLQAFVSTVAYAYGWIIIRQLVKYKDYRPFFVTGVAMATGGIATLLTSLVVEGWSTPPVFSLLPFCLYLIAIIIISEIISANLYASLLRQYTATLLAFAGFMYPVFSALLGWMVLRESITWNFIASSCIVLVGLYIFYIEESVRVRGGIVMIILVIIAHMMLAAIFPIGRAIVHNVQPIFFTALRMLVSGIILMGYQYARYGKIVPGKPSRHAMRLFILFTLFAMFLTNVPEFWALQYVPSAKASFIYSITPFFAALLSYFFFDEKFTIKKGLGMIIGFGGFAIMIIYDAPLEEPIGGIGIISWGEIALLIAAISTAYGWIKGRKLIRDYQYSSVVVNGVSMFWCGIAALIASLATESWQPVPLRGPIAPFIGYLLLSVVCSNLIGYVLIGVIIKHYTTTLMSFIGFIEPFIAALYAWLLLGEVVTWRFFAAAVIVFVGLYIFYMEELRQGYVVKPGR